MRVSSFLIGQCWSRPDIMKPFYSDFDWDQTVIGGSYALNQFTGDTAWVPNDVDIFIAANSLLDFQLSVQAFVNHDAKSRQVEKFSDFSKGHPDDAKRDEKFHEAIRASAKVRVDGVEQELQFVYIHVDPPTVSGLCLILDQITDLPSCVRYQVPYGQKQFHIPQKGVASLFTRQVNLSDVCPSRRAKYQDRGYTFFQ